mmetsp:Transcript_12899/g.21168  ORF Transcript_12899/g.21168 Transcript_12899/m.21168 type:complete len:85 (-) Transcript_12899:25-279(-)
MVRCQIAQSLKACLSVQTVNMCSKYLDVTFLLLSEKEQTSSVGCILHFQLKIGGVRETSMSICIKENVGAVEYRLFSDDQFKAQ